MLPEVDSKCGLSYPQAHYPSYSLQRKRQCMRKIKDLVSSWDKCPEQHLQTHSAILPGVCEHCELFFRNRTATSKAAWDEPCVSYLSYKITSHLQSHPNGSYFRKSYGMLLMPATVQVTWAEVRGTPVWIKQEKLGCICLCDC